VRKRRGGGGATHTKQNTQSNYVSTSEKMKRHPRHSLHAEKPRVQRRQLGGVNAKSVPKGASAQATGVAENKRAKALHPCW